MTGYESKKAAAQDKYRAVKTYHEGKPVYVAQPAQEAVAKYCCHVCFNKSGQTFLDRMIICSECGNKRCPKATNHALPCTDSNEPNQAGSVFTNTPQPAQEPVQVSVEEFVHIVEDKEHLVGRPIVWAQWPSEEKNNG